MPLERTDDKTIANKKGWFRHLVWIVSILILIMLAVFIIAVVRLVPSVIRQEIERGLSEFCEGAVEIESVEADYSGQIHLGGIKFYDKAKREWLFVEKVKADLANWPGLSPVITEIEIEGVGLQILAAEGKFILPPVHLSQQSAAPSSKPDVRKLTITKAAIAIVDTQGSKTVYDNLTLSAFRKDSIYEFLLNRVSAESSEIFHAEGKVNYENLNLDASLQINHRFTKSEMITVLTALNMPGVSAEGKLVADLKIAGRLNEPSGLQSSGNIKFNDFVLYVKDKVLANDVVATAKLESQRISFDELSAVVCNGPVNGSIYIEAKQNQPIEFGGQFLAQKMSFVELTSILGGPGRKATKGSVTLNYNFTAKGSGLQGISGDGQIFLDDADISVFPVIPHIFSAAGLIKLDPLRMADAECMFSMAGPVVKINSAHIANPYAAIAAEPGGTIDLQTKRVEMYVKAVPLEKIDSLIRQVPVIDIVFNLKDKLTRLYIRGNWSDPPAKLITKRPIEDIKEGTVGFLQDVLKNGGQISQAMLKGFGVFFKAPANSNKKNKN
ncbi:MAG: AsmA-like C-terminal region-containing protein [Sedimentisphaerales bacterium]